MSGTTLTAAQCDEIASLANFLSLDDTLRAALIAGETPVVPPPNPRVGPLKLALRTDGTVQVEEAPAGTAWLHVGYSDSLTGGNTNYAYVPFVKEGLLLHLSAMPGFPYIGAQPCDTNKTPIAGEGWTSPRILAGTIAPPPPPVEPPPHLPMNSCLPGFCLNAGNVAKIAAQGGRILRIEGDIGALSMEAANAGIYCVPILPITSPFPRAQYDALPQRQKNAILGFCWGNEQWPGGIGHQISGRAYGESYIPASKAARGTKPLYCQINLTPANTSWTVELVATPGLKEALAGNALDHHSYGASMMTPLVDPGNPLDQSHGWESRRWTSEVAYVWSKLGILVPSFISECGDSISRVGSVIGCEARDNGIFDFATLVKRQAIPAAELYPGMPHPELIGWSQYDLIGNRSGYETYGQWFYAEGGKSEEPVEPRNANWRARAKTLAAA